LLLSIDTATRTAGIALYDQEGLRAEQLWHTGENHTTELLPYIVRLCDQVGIGPDGLTAVGVSLGPGSFTGLRVGLSVAKGLCLALELPIFGVPTLDATAYAHQRETIPVCAVLPAGRGRLCVAVYGGTDGQWSRRTDYQLVPCGDLPALLTEPTLVCGELDCALIQTLATVVPNLAIVASSASAPRRAGYLAEMAWRRLQSGPADDPVSLSPLYLQTL
jgi:tRNA threonylcarbamoyladenosine biosynthesis protein TsaB